jgi:predicted transcriptional regulator YdeE
MAPRKPKPDHAVCHPDRTVYARSLCRRCYDRARWSGQVQHSSTGVKAIIEEVASQVPRAVRKIPTESQYIRTANPKVAEHVAAVMVKNCLDAEKAAAELKPDLSPLAVAQTAAKLENDPRVQRAVQKELQKRSLDKDSRNHFVDLLWRYAESEDPADEKRQLQSMRILGKAFISESIEITKPSVLRITGIDEEIKQMFDGHDPREKPESLTPEFDS